ncbi:MAG: phenylacetate-CoA oxygenase subunit PaaI [Chloroflexota bacterium]|nr:phenylacetate-CoA oxygenase subunit PaaI [Chloroflexota bacterium]
MAQEVFAGTVKDREELGRMPAEYQEMVRKVVRSHMINELAGAEAFDVPAVDWAKTAEDKWMALQIAQEEYGHHVMFSRLGRTMGLDADSLDIKQQALSVFQVKVESWVEFLMVKAIVDLAEVVMIDDLEESSYEPLKELSIKTLPEERFHTGFGRQRLKQVVKTPEGRAEAQAALDKLYPVTLGFFGASISRNNELYRRWHLKKRTNDEMREDYTRRVREVAAELGLTMPEVSFQPAVS